MVIRTKVGNAYAIKAGTDIIFLSFGMNEFGLGFVVEDGAYMTLPLSQVDRIYR